MKVKAQSGKAAEKLACVILAAGKGTRMRSNLPKVMHRVAHKPMLLHVIDTALAVKPENVVVVTSPEMQVVREIVSKCYKDRVENAVQTQQLGTGDAVKAAKNVLKDFKGIVFVLYGDTPLVQDETLRHMAAALAKSRHSLVVLAIEPEHPGDYGRLVLNAKGELMHIVEAKDASAKEKTIRLCNSGVIAVRAAALSTLLGKITNKNAKGEYYLTDLVALARKAGSSCGVVKAQANELMGVNSRAELAVAERTLQERLRAQAMESGVTLLDPHTVYFAADTHLGKDVMVHPHVFFGPGVSVEDNVEIRSFCHIEDTTIGANAIIGPFARIRPGTQVGESAHIGNFVEIKKSTIERGAKVNHLSYIGDAHVGESSNIGAGTITCNYDGYNKHRTIIGAGVFIGSDTALVAPVTVGDGAFIGAGSVITEDVEADALAIARAPQKQKQGWAKNFRNRKNH